MRSFLSSPLCYAPWLLGLVISMAFTPPSSEHCVDEVCATKPIRLPPSGEEAIDDSAFLQTRTSISARAKDMLNNDAIPTKAAQAAVASAAKKGERTEALTEQETEETGEFDCADEMVLRLAIADSFFGPSYDDCVAQQRERAFQPGGSGTAESQQGSGGSGLSEEQVEERIRSRCITRMGHGVALGPRLLRMTFHDAADYNNLMFANGTTAPLSMGGVDSCLHTALLSAGLNQQDDTEDADDEIEVLARGEPNHNRGLGNAERWVMYMSQASKLSRPDIQVLGTVVALEAWLSGPELGASYGRTQGHCSRIICSSESCWHHDTPFFVQPVAEPVGGGMMCPMTNTLGPLQDLLNMTLPEMVALQGSHSVGGVIVCSGLGNVARGPYCPNKCGIPSGDFFANGNLDGTVFDDTPGKLDNRYYQLLMNEVYEDLPACTIARSYFPRLSNRGLSNAGEQSVGGSGSGGGRDLTETCQDGVPYESENACEVEACAEACTLTQACVEAANVDSADHEVYRAAVQGCNACKANCSSRHRMAAARPAGREYRAQCETDCSESEPCVTTRDHEPWGDMRQACDALRDQCLADAGLTDWSRGQCNGACNTERNTCREPCNSLQRSERRACRNQCNDVRNTCREACSERHAESRACTTNVRASCLDNVTDLRNLDRECRQCTRGCRAAAAAYSESIYNTSMEPRPARWCKRLSEIRQCLDPDITLPLNGGWGECPEEMRITMPNIGQGRLTIIQNMERWTTFRGLHKRIMVLPSDWSWLGREDTKALFQRYGEDNDEFHANFATAFTKLASTGYGDSLRTCTRVPCTLTDGTISCPVPEAGIGAMGRRETRQFNRRREEAGLPEFERPASLDFDASECEPPMTGEEDCELIGGFGIKAKLQCGDSVGFCLTTAAAEAEARIAQEWESGGQTAPQCEGD